MKKAILMLAAAWLLTACGGGAQTNSNGGGSNPAKSDGPPKIQMVMKGNNYDFEIKDAVIYNTKIRTDDKNKVSTLMARHNIILANFPITNMWNQPLTSPEQYVVRVEMNAEAGTDGNSVPKVGVFEIGKSGENNVSEFAIVVFKDGKQQVLDIANIPFEKQKGTVKIISSEGNTVKGEIDLTADGNTLKGAFTASLKPNPTY